MGSEESVDSLQLVFCVREKWGCCQDLRQLIRKSNLQERVILTGSVLDSDLAVLYLGAACCAMPSLYEGFGLPVLEAMASGSLLICSNRSWLAEIVGGATVYFDPESEEEIAVATEKLLDDSAVRHELVERGIERARQFSWESCARTTLAAFKSF
jgi:glycosyltransferase involved in cell wall biosynthesis